MDEQTKIGMTELVGMLESPDPDFRRFALATIGIAAVNDRPFEAYLEDAQGGVQQRFEVATFGRSAVIQVHSLTRMVDDPSADVRAPLATALKVYGGPAVEEVIALTKDMTSSRRDMLKALLTLSDDPDSEVRSAARAAIFQEETDDQTGKETGEVSRTTAVVFLLICGALCVALGALVTLVLTRQ